MELDHERTHSPFLGLMNIERRMVVSDIDRGKSKAKENCSTAILSTAGPTTIHFTELSRLFKILYFVGRSLFL